MVCVPCMSNGILEMTVHKRHAQFMNACNGGHVSERPNASLLF